MGRPFRPEKALRDIAAAFGGDCDLLLRLPLDVIAAVVTIRGWLN
jgi:hypothetical protein